MGVGDWFREFCSELVVSQVASISSRYQKITKRLNTDYWSTESSTAHSLYVGSYGRNTAIDGFSDLDMVFQLPYEVYKQYDKYTGNGQSALLQAVKKSIEKTYSTTSIRGDGQVIQVPFDDGITFEVVPAFINENDSFTFPDANGGGSWRTTNPKPEIAAIRKRNNECNSNLIRLCRMARSWKRECDVPIGGLLIDTFAYQFIDGYAHKYKSYLYYDFMMRDFFDYVRNLDKTQEYWLAPGSGQRVYKKGEFHWKATRAYNLSLEAIAHEQAKPSQTWSAKNKWREVFGTRFPK